MSPSYERVSISMNDPHPYCKIIIAGPLNEHWYDYLGDLLVIVDVKEGQIQNTTMLGRPGDLTTYSGMLNALVNLGMTVIATEYRQPASIDGTEGGFDQGQRVYPKPGG
jgi:hypothetical protein